MTKSPENCKNPCAFTWNGKNHACRNCGRILTDEEIRQSLEDTAITAAASSPQSAEWMIRELKAEIARLIAQRDAAFEFAISTDRDLIEWDKMFLHINRLKQVVGYNAYLVEVSRSIVKPMTFEEYLKDLQGENRRVINSKAVDEYFRRRIEGAPPHA